MLRRGGVPMPPGDVGGQPIRQNVRVVDSDEQLRDWIVRTADEHGAAVLHVPSDDRGSAYAFTAGVWRRFGKPEAVVIGLPRDVAHTVVNTYIRRISAGERFVAGCLYEGFLQGCPVVIERIAHGHYSEFLGSAVLLHQSDDFPAVQLIVSSPDGKFPWQDDAPGGFAAHQPVLTASGQPESWSPGVTGP